MDIDGTSCDFWDLVELFYGAWGQYRRLFDAYEEQVIHYASDRGVDRKDLKLSAEELSGLFDFKALERLRDDFLEKLKRKAHKLFRTEESTDTFDRSISEIFHEVSILKEEHYAVKTYGPEQNKEISELILDEVHHYFPIRLNKINLLFARANTRFKALLVQNAHNRILVRSLYIFGEALLKGIFPGGLEDLYRVMYPERGPVDGFWSAARSFFESGFWDLSEEALDKCEASAGGGDLFSKDLLQDVAELRRQIRLKKP